MRFFLLITSLAFNFNFISPSQADENEMGYAQCGPYGSGCSTPLGSTCTPKLICPPGAGTVGRIGKTFCTTKEFEGRKYVNCYTAFECCR